MAAHQVHQRVKKDFGVVFLQAADQTHQVLGIAIMREKPDQHISQRVIHHRVERVTQAVAAHTPVGHLVAGIFPHLAQKGSVRILDSG
ncbi:hypothetical protein SDC9_178974 [bioreactor metagenome]|uniref:Uncharacterized protein n=1 Tax=bioreactor metagenome TaxID=1076179 RepID=A0A645GYM5_9ZZZZ